jgi:hypothetical protein
MTDKNSHQRDGRIKELESAGFFDYNHGDYTKEKYESTSLNMDEIIAGIKSMKEKHEAAI